MRTVLAAHLRKPTLFTLTIRQLAAGLNVVMRRPVSAHPHPLWGVAMRLLAYRQTLIREKHHFETFHFQILNCWAYRSKNIGNELKDLKHDLEEAK